MINIGILFNDIKESIDHGTVHPGSLVVVSWKGSMFPLGKVLPINYMGTAGITLCLYKPYDAPPLTYEDPPLTAHDLVTAMDMLMHANDHSLVAANDPTILNITEVDGSATRPPDHSDVMGMDGILLLRFV